MNEQQRNKINTSAKRLHTYFDGLMHNNITGKKAVISHVIEFIEAYGLKADVETFASDKQRVQITVKVENIEVLSIRLIFHKNGRLYRKVSNYMPLAPQAQNEQNEQAQKTNNEGGKNKMVKRQYEKFDYSIIKTGVSTPIAYAQNGIIKTVFRTIKMVEGKTVISLGGEKQEVAKTSVKHKGITTIVIDGKNAISKKSVKKAEKVQAEKVEKVQAKKVEKVQKERVKKSVKPIVKKEKEFDLVSLDEIKNAIDNLNILDDSEITYTIQSFLYYGHINETTGKEVDGIFLHPSFVPYYSVLEGLKTLNNAKTLQQVQAVLLGQVMPSMVERMAYNVLTNGYKGKDVLEEMDYYARNSVSLQTSLLYKYETKDLLHTVVMDSLRLDFKMFNSPKNIAYSVKMRLKNALAVLDKGVMNGKKVTNVSFEKIENIETKAQLITGLNVTKDVAWYRTMVENASHLVNFTDKEQEVFFYQVVGYSNKEIDAILKQRNDRTYKAVAKKIKEKTGLTLKDVKKAMEQERKAEKERLQAMKERQEQAKQA